ncbi:hypothetical protein HK104_003489, partial [Borealophlyctis nickersoniae]
MHIDREQLWKAGGYSTFTDYMSGRWKKSSSAAAYIKQCGKVFEVTSEYGFPEGPPSQRVCRTLFKESKTPPFIAIATLWAYTLRNVTTSGKASGKLVSKLAAQLRSETAPQPIYFSAAEDRWNTPAALAREINDFFGGYVGLDSCWNSSCHIKAHRMYGETTAGFIDALVIPTWRPPQDNKSVFLNPPSKLNGAVSYQYLFTRKLDDALKE